VFIHQTRSCEQQQPSLWTLIGRHVRFVDVNNGSRGRSPSPRQLCDSDNQFANSKGRARTQNWCYKCRLCPNSIRQGSREGVRRKVRLWNMHGQLTYGVTTYEWYITSFRPWKAKAMDFWLQHVDGSIVFLFFYFRKWSLRRKIQKHI